MYAERLFLVKKKVRGQKYWIMAEKVKSFHVKEDAEKFMSEIPEDGFDYSVEVEGDFEYEIRKMECEWFFGNTNNPNP